MVLIGIVWHNLMRVDGSCSIAVVRELDLEDVITHIRAPCRVRNYQTLDSVQITVEICYIR